MSIVCLWWLVNTVRHNERARCFPRAMVETKKWAKSRVISLTYGYCFVSAGWDNKQWLPYTVATTSFQCDDTYAALISLYEGGGGRRNAHAVLRADRVYICIWNIHSRCYTSTKHMLIAGKFGMMITLQKNTKKGESSGGMNIHKQFMEFF